MWQAAFEGKFFEWCAASNLTVLAVSHNAELHSHFTHQLTLDKGQCTMRSSTGSA